MLVHFESDVGGFTMFGDVAVQLLKMMGHSGTVPSALQTALRTQPPPPPEPDEGTVDQHGDRKEPRISIHTRAVPLVDLLTRAARRGSDITWR
jgi:hypothetical protein